jgi:hypothetical protein
LQWRRNSRSGLSGDELRARALDTTARAGQLRRKRKMNMERQEKQKEQCRRANQPARSSYCSNAKTRHASEANRWLLPCQSSTQTNCDSLAKP